MFSDDFKVSWNFDETLSLQHIII